MVTVHHVSPFGLALGPDGLRRIDLPQKPCAFGGRASRMCRYSFRHALDDAPRLTLSVPLRPLSSTLYHSGKPENPRLQPGNRSPVIFPARMASTGSCYRWRTKWWRLAGQRLAVTAIPAPTERLPGGQQVNGLGCFL